MLFGQENEIQIFPFYKNKRNGTKFGFMNKKGKVIVKAKFSGASNFSEGRAAIKWNDKWGYINLKGKIVINPKFERVENFAEDLAVVRVNGKYGFIGKDGKFVIEPKFDKVDSGFSEGFAIVKDNEDEKPYIINKKGVAFFKEKYEKILSFSEELAPVRVNGKWGYINKSGKLAINIQYEKAYNFSGELAAVKLKGEMGFIDKSGILVIKPIYKYVSDFSEGLAAVEVKGNWGYINTCGDLVIEPQYSLAMPFSEGLAICELGGAETIVINKEGMRMNESQLIGLGKFKNGIAHLVHPLFTYPGVWTFIDKGCRILWQSDY